MHTYSGHLRSQGWHRTGGSSMMWAGGIRCLPASDRVTHSDRSTPFATIPHDPVSPCPCPVDEVNSSKAAHTGQSLDALGSHQVVCR